MTLTYSPAVWLLFFFTYCVLGWIWESSYVSIRKGHWINRGFLHGPWLPIYGFGAIIILFLTLPFKDHPVMIYIFGMLGATLLEYVTGALMEKIFHTRYWDYSHQPLNLHGYICLGCSLGWGAFSLLLVMVIHRSVESLIFKIPYAFLKPASVILLLLFIIDVIVSAIEALNFKVLLQRNIQINEQLQNIQNKLETISGGNSIKESPKAPQTLLKWREAIVAEWENKHRRQLKRIDDMLLEIQNLAAKNEEIDFSLLHERLRRLKEEAGKNNDKKYRHSLRITWRNPNLMKISHPDLFDQLFKKQKQHKNKDKI